MGAVRAGVWLLALCLTLGACGRASWQSIYVAPGYRPPAALTIHISDRPQWREVSRALGSALQKELKSHDIRVTLIEDTDTKPDVLVTIEEWDDGSRALRWVSSGAAGEGATLVLVEYTSQGQLLIDGRVRGRLKAGPYGGDAIEAATAAGELIGEVLATGEGKPDPALQTEEPDQHDASE